MDSKTQNLRTLLCGEALREFGTLLGHIGYTTNGNLTLVVLILGTYLFPIGTVNLTVRVNPTNRESQRAKLERYFLECVY